jgi:hypothetical protein
MNRRDFLFLRPTPRGRTLELSCRALYMRTLDAQAPTTQAEGAVLAHEPWMGEPPADFQKSDPDDWLREVEAQLRDVAILKLLDQEWLTPTGINEQLEPVLTAFLARGGHVEYASS